jgi:hypothetical protein
VSLNATSKHDQLDSHVRRAVIPEGRAQQKLPPSPHEVDSERSNCNDLCHLLMIRQRAGAIMCATGLEQCNSAHSIGVVRTLMSESATVSRYARNIINVQRRLMSPACTPSITKPGAQVAFRACTKMNLMAGNCLAGTTVTDRQLPAWCTCSFMLWCHLYVGVWLTSVRSADRWCTRPLPAYSA